MVKDSEKESTILHSKTKPFSKKVQNKIIL